MVNNNYNLGHSLLNHPALHLCLHQLGEVPWGATQGVPPGHQERVMWEERIVEDLIE